VGVCLCCGTWLEGGELMGMDVVGAVEDSFRNVSAPVPHFVEAFVDSGYMEMWTIMRTLREVEFDGVAIGDHFPQMTGGNRTAVERANAEFAV
jgi:mannonate dehydratase